MQGFDRLTVSSDGNQTRRTEFAIESSRVLVPGFLLCLACGAILASLNAPQLVPTRDWIGPSLLVLAFLALSRVFAISLSKNGFWSAGTLLALGLGLYYPLRGLFLISGALNASRGVNPRVVALLSDESAGHTSFLVALASLSFAAAYTFPRRAAPWHRGRSSPQVSRVASEAYWVFLAFGVIALASEVPRALDFLGGVERSSNVVTQLTQLLGFGFYLGIVLGGRESWGGGQQINFRSAGLVALGLGIAVAAGSKEVFVQVILAFGIAYRPRFRLRKRFSGAILALGIPLVLVFGVFPVMVSYRNMIQRGTAPAVALESSISFDDDSTELSKGGGWGPLLEPIFYLTNRLHGFDSFLLGVHAERDPQIISFRDLALVPMAIFTPDQVAFGAARDVGLLFARRYWGLQSPDNTRIATGFLVQGEMALGLLGPVVLGLLLALMVRKVDYLLLDQSNVRKAFGFTLLVSLLSFERDMIAVTVVTGRRLLLLSLLVIIFAKKKEFSRGELESNQSPA